MSKNGQHVVPSSGGRWAVRRTGASRASRRFDSKTEALEYGTTLAKKEQAALYVHRRDGTIQRRDSYGEPLTSASRK